MKILVVEDQAQNQYLMKYLLESKGHTVLLAERGESGLQLAQNESPDLILLDIQLPGMSGHEVATELRKRRETLDTPIVAVTSYAMPGDREAVFASGCTGYIEKPINPDTFLDEVMQCIAKPPGKSLSEPSMEGRPLE